MTEKKRVFIAVHFSDEVIENISRILSHVRQAIGEQTKIKWVPPDNIHLTLQFLGDVDVGLLPKLSGGLRGAFGDVQPFEISASEVGAFPSPARPRVIWVGIRSGADSLKVLQACVERVTDPLGFPPEKRDFSPHITVGRVKDFPRVADLSAALTQFNTVQAGKCRIETVHLMSSTLKPTGPVYSVLDSFPIGR